MSNNIITTSLILVFCFSTFSSSSSADDKPAKPRPKITISKETTFITKPLDADGYPDYVAALNQHCSRGVTPENNAAVLFWKAVGPAEIEPERREQYFKMLGMEPLSEKGEYFRLFLKQVELHESKNKSVAAKDDEYYLDPLYGQLEEIGQRPWASEEFPVCAEWLKVNERPMALLVEASKRLRRFDPWFNDKVESKQIGFNIQCVNSYRDVARAFRARAMLRVHEGKTAEAWEDLMTVRRLARLFGQGPTFVEYLVAITIDSIGQSGERVFACSVKLQADKIAAYQREMDSLPPVGDFPDMINIGERLFYASYFMPVVDMTPAESNVYIKKNFLGNLPGVDAENESSVITQTLNILKDTDIDWNIVLKTGNTWFDRLVAAARQPTRSERQKAFEEIEQEFQSTRKSLRTCFKIA